MNKRLLLFVIVVFCCGLAMWPDVVSAARVPMGRSYPVYIPVLSLVIPGACLGLALALWLAGPSGRRGRSHYAGALAGLAAVQGINPADIAVFFSYGTYLAFMDRLALSLLPFAPVLFLVLVRDQVISRVSYRIIPVLLSLVFAISAGILFLPYDHFLAMHGLVSIFCLSGFAVGILEVGLSRSGERLRPVLVILCGSTVILALVDDLVSGWSGGRDASLLAVSLGLSALICGTLSARDLRRSRHSRKLELRHLLDLRASLEQKIKDHSSEINNLRIRMDNLLEHIPEAVLTLDSEARLLRYEGGAGAMFGWNASEVVGRSMIALIAGEWAERFLRSLRRLESEGESEWGSPRGFEVQIRNRDGRILPTMCSISIINEGDATLFQVLLRSIESERKAQMDFAAQKAATSDLQDRLRLIEERTSTGWYETSSIMGKTRWSPGLEMLWGFREGFRPTGLRDFVARIVEADRPQIIHSLDDPSWDEARYTVRVQIDDVRVATIELSLVRVRAADGTIVRETGIAHRLYEQSVVPLPATMAARARAGWEGAGMGGASDTGIKVGSGLSENSTSDDALNILLVEDVEVNQRVAVMFLEREGHRVSVASTGEDGVAAVAEGRFDLVLMDIRLPDIDGVEAVRRIRALADPVRSQVPVLALTANVFDEDVRRYHAAGMNGVVAKPIRMEPFRQALRSIQAAASEGDKSSSITDEGGSDVIFPSLDEGFIADRLSALGAESFMAILGLGRRSMEGAVAELSAAVGLADADALGKSGHKLAGAASNFGFSRLVKLGRDIEDYALQGNVEQAGELAREASELWKDACHSLQIWLGARNLLDQCREVPTPL